jgi:dTDP-4-amino-4,6-dideoxygalactose transaminase
MKNINLFVPFFRKKEILSQIEECLDKGWTGLGFKTQQIEEDWKKYTGLPHAHFLNSNTSGLHLAVKILKDANKWKEGDEIITTPLTFVSSNHSILYERLKPVFADVDDKLTVSDPLAEFSHDGIAVVFSGSSYSSHASKSIGYRGVLSNTRTNLHSALLLAVCKR